MEDLSILIGGKAGFGIDKAGIVIAGVMNRLGYRLYIYRDYPSLIRGGHTYSVIRASDSKIAGHKDKINFMMALNQETIDLHKDKLAAGAAVIYDSDSVKKESLPQNIKALGIPLADMLKEDAAPEIMRNTCVIGAFCKAAGIGADILESVLKNNFSKDVELNLKIAHKGYGAAEEVLKIPFLKNEPLPVVSGNEAVGIGLLKGGIKAYIAYPMTPSSPILHFLASVAGDFGIKAIHPESEIAVIMMALGLSYCGNKVAVGTSGGGFCLMTEGLGLSAMAELPVVIVLGQRPGPSTGLPTYSSQTELHFALNASQGEFTRLVIAPGDPEEACFWSHVAVNLSWKYQIPSIILTDKTLGEGVYSFEMSLIPELKDATQELWDKKTSYKRYLDTETGVSPLAFVPEKDNVIKVNSYEHDESGITTEDPVVVKSMQDKRLKKEAYLSEDIDLYGSVKVYGNKDSSTAILCWGSSKGACIEAAANLNLKVIQPLVLSPFPFMRVQKALKGVKRLIAVECNATAQLVKLLNQYGLEADDRILRYDGRPFSIDELEAELKELLK